MSQFAALRLSNWRQFERVQIDLSAQTTILTGANGCGKTSILTVLSHHFGWHVQFVATPYVSKKDKRRLYTEFAQFLQSPKSGLVSTIPTDADDGVPTYEHESDETKADDAEEDFQVDLALDHTAQEVGEVVYSDGGICTLASPNRTSQNAQYHLQYGSMQSIVGMYIPSHRPATTYHSVGQVPTDPKTNAQQYQEFQQLLLQGVQGANIRNPGGVMKQSLIALALFGYGNLAVVENSDYRSLFESFQEVLRKILPKKLGFQKLEIRMPEVVLITDTGQFALDAMSGGINALFTIAWQIQMFTWDKEACTILIDEPENHLHPSMQRSLLPSLANAFPKYRFVVASHSPFIVASDPSANVFALMHNENRRIESTHLESADLAASPDTVLREVLEVPNTMPIWVESRLQQALAEFKDHATDPAALDRLFAQLKALGLNDSLAYLPSQEGVTK